MKFTQLILWSVCIFTTATFATIDTTNIVPSIDSTVNQIQVAATDSIGNAIIDSSISEHIADTLVDEIAYEQDSISEFNENIVSDSTDDTLEGAEADAELAQDIALADTATLDSSLILDMQKAFVPTASKRISAPYGIRTYRMHRGVDMGLCQGENRTIVAAFSGTVIKVRNQGRRKGYGKYVILDHGNGLTTLYAHLASWKVNIGDTLQAGDTIGIGGNSGRSFGAHLHFEMRYNGIYIDPTTIFDFEQSSSRSSIIKIEPKTLRIAEDSFQKELSKHRYYKVRRGDCLGKIARRYGISITQLKQLNGIKGNMIRPGQVLRCS